MIVLKEYPPNYESIKAKLKPGDMAVFTWGSIIYAPKVDFQLPEDLIVHEETHEIQQDGDPMTWWYKYLEFPEFRFDQELKAYRNQYRYFVNHHNRNQAFFFLDALATDFASPMYGKIINHQDAMKLIKL